MFGDQCYKHTHGTVIIDEIDEHLHPALQVRVLKALQDTFPRFSYCKYACSLGDVIS